MSNPPKNRWRDGQQADVDDFRDEQDHHDSNRECVVLDFHGEGVVLDGRLQPVIFNSVTHPDTLDDGRPIQIEVPTSDNVNGNLLEVNVTFGDLDGYASARLILTGTDRDGG